MQGATGPVRMPWTRSVTGGSWTVLSPSTGVLGTSGAAAYPQVDTSTGTDVRSEVDADGLAGYLVDFNVQ